MDTWKSEIFRLYRDFVSVDNHISKLSRVHRKRRYGDGELLVWKDWDYLLKKLVERMNIRHIHEDLDELPEQMKFIRGAKWAEIWERYPYPRGTKHAPRRADKYKSAEA